MVMDVVKNLKVNDLFYERGGDVIEEFVVLTIPIKDESGYWSWMARGACPINPLSAEIIDFGVNENYLEYAPEISLSPTEWLKDI